MAERKVVGTLLSKCNGDDKGEHECDLLDPEHYSLEEVSARFECYKKRRAEEHAAFKLRAQSSDLRTELSELRLEVDKLHRGIEQLHDHSSAWQQQQIEHLHAIESAHSLAYNRDSCTNLVPNDLETNPNKILIITCGYTSCLFRDCKRRVNSQLMLLHYLSDHNLQPCHNVHEGERVVLSIQPKRCHIHKNRVLCLLAYGGALERKFIQADRCMIFNSFLPKEHEHLESHVPVVVLICKTADKTRASQEKKVYAIWLVTPNEHLRLNASLSLCGRDTALRMCSIVAVRSMCHSQDPCHFMSMDKDYWRLSFSDVQLMSNDFRDELHLEVALEELGMKSSHKVA